MSRVVLLTFDNVGARLAASAIRALELARALSEAGHQPTVVTPVLEANAEVYPFPVRAFDLHAPARTLLPMMSAAEVIVLPLHALARVPSLARVRAPLVIDIYDPFVFELLASGANRSVVQAHCSVLNHALRRGDFFLCASERQRDLWLGALVANGRVVPAPDAEASFRHLIDVVPLGIPELPPVRTPCWRPASISPDHTIIVSAGVPWHWQDPATALRAIARVAERRSDVHLLFFTGAHPKAEAVRAMAGGLGVLDRQVHFVNEWVAYAQRGSYLSACNAGFTTHRPSLESRFSFRTRVLDYLWAGLPVVCTKGDVLACIVERHELGIVVPPSDDGALATAFERIADDRVFVDACRTRIADIRPSLAWSVAAQPLVRYCDAPRMDDRRAHGLAGIRDLAGSAWRVLRSEGLRSAAERIHRHGFLRG